jgi:hypothetical protein
MARPGAPPWALKPFERFFEYIGVEQRLVSVAADGIDLVARREQSIEVLFEPFATGGWMGGWLPETQPEEAGDRIRAARTAAVFARSELDTDFPLLHAHSLVGAWGALEALVDDVARSWLTNWPSLMATEAFSDIKVSVGTFQSMTRAQRIDYVLAQVSRSHETGDGVGRLESLLADVGLGGRLDDRLRRRLVEIHQIRNVYAHRGGLADADARAACPWRRDWKLGEQILVGNEAYAQYLGSLGDFAVELIVRTGAKFGLDLRAHLAGTDRAAARPSAEPRSVDTLPADAGRRRPSPQHPASRRR